MTTGSEYDRMRKEARELGRRSVSFTLPDGVIDWSKVAEAIENKYGVRDGEPEILVITKHMVGSGASVVAKINRFVFDEYPDGDAIDQHGLADDFTTSDKSHEGDK